MALLWLLIIAYIVRAAVGLRPTPEVEIAGLDLSELNLADTSGLFKRKS